MEREIPYRGDGLDLTGLMVHEDAAASSPGVLVIHGGAGLDAHAADRARRFAALGYAAFACDMYGAGVAGDRERIVATIGELRADRDRLMRRGRAGIEVLTSHPFCDGRVAVVGYCFGGMAALELARGGIDAAVCVAVHGSLATSRPAAKGEIRARILVCHGALDPHSPPSSVAAFVDEMNASGADWELIAYGRAMHGFTHENAKGQTPGVLYDEAADARSSGAIRRLLEETWR